MNAMAIMVAGVAIALLSLLLVSRRKPQSVGSQAKALARHSQAREERTQRKRLPGVSINAAPHCCQEAKLVEGVRFHPDDAPTLPLPGCSLDVCKCTYVHHSDRRSGTLDRRRLTNLKKDYALFFGREDQREGRGRRASDWKAAYENTEYLSY